MLQFTVYQEIIQVSILVVMVEVGVGVQVGVEVRDKVVDKVGAEVKVGVKINKRLKSCRFCPSLSQTSNNEIPVCCQRLRSARPKQVCLSLMPG